MSNSNTFSNEENEHIVCMAAMLKCDSAVAEKILTICSVVTPEQLYAKYIAVGKADALFAAALNIAPEEWTAMMDRLRLKLPNDILEKLETPLPMDKMPITGYNPSSKRLPANESGTGDVSDDEDGHETSRQNGASDPARFESDKDGDDQGNCNPEPEKDSEK